MIKNIPAKIRLIPQAIKFKNAIEIIEIINDTKNRIKNSFVIFVFNFQFEIQVHLKNIQLGFSLV